LKIAKVPAGKWHCPLCVADRVSNSYTPAQIAQRYQSQDEQKLNRLRNVLHTFGAGYTIDLKKWNIRRTSYFNPACYDYVGPDGTTYRSTTEICRALQHRRLDPKTMRIKKKQNKKSSSICLGSKRLSVNIDSKIKKKQKKGSLSMLGGHQFGGGGW